MPQFALIFESMPCANRVRIGTRLLLQPTATLLTTDDAVVP
jgi:hypothetical protein